VTESPHTGVKNLPTSRTRDLFTVSPTPPSSSRDDHTTVRLAEIDENEHKTDCWRASRRCSLQAGAGDKLMRHRVMSSQRLVAPPNPAPRRRRRNSFLDAHYWATVGRAGARPLCVLRRRRRTAGARIVSPSLSQASRDLAD